MVLSSFCVRINLFFSFFCVCVLLYDLHNKINKINSQNSPRMAPSGELNNIPVIVFFMTHYDPQRHWQHIRHWAVFIFHTTPDKLHIVYIVSKRRPRYYSFITFPNICRFSKFFTNYFCCSLFIQKCASKPCCSSNSSFNGGTDRGDKTCPNITGSELVICCSVQSSRYVIFFSLSFVILN